MSRSRICRTPAQPCPSSTLLSFRSSSAEKVKRKSFASPHGLLEGYQLRFQLGAPQPDGTVLETWTEWLHLPNPLMLYLAESLDAFMRTEGHLAVPKPAAAAPAVSLLPAAAPSAARAA